MTDPLFQRGNEYQQFRPSYPGCLFEWLAGACRQHHLAVDTGCGSGQASRGLEPYFGQVLATDISENQLCAAPDSGCHYLLSQAHQLPVANDSVDLLTCAQAFHWFDQPAFLAEAQRVLRPGGVIALISYGLCEAETLTGLIRSYHDDTLGRWWPPQRAQLMAGYPDASLPWPTLDFPATDIVRDWSLDQMLGYLDTWSALVKARQQGLDPLKAFANTLRAGWGGELTRTIRWPLRVKAWRKPGQR